MKLKKIASLFMALVMVMSLSVCFTFATSAKDDYETSVWKSGTDGNIDWKVYVTETTETIKTNRTFTYSLKLSKNAEAASGVMLNYGTGSTAGNIGAGVKAPWSELKEKKYVYNAGKVRYDAVDDSGVILFDDVTVENGVTAIGNYAFYFLSYKELNLADSVRKIGEYACAGYGRRGDFLKTVVLPASLSEFGKNAFADQDALTTVDFAKATRLGTIGDRAFADCGALKDVKIGDSVTYIGHEAFKNCKSLKSIEIGKNVKYIGSAAFSCGNLERVYIYIEDTEDVEIFSTPKNDPNSKEEAYGAGAFTGNSDDLRIYVLSDSSLRRKLVLEYGASHICDIYKVVFRTDGYNVRFLLFFTLKIDAKVYATEYGFIDDFDHTERMVYAPKNPEEKYFNFTGWELLDKQDENETYDYPTRNMEVVAKFEKKGFLDIIIDWLS